MKHINLDLNVEPKTQQGTLCGHSLFGSDTGTCPCCSKHKQLMANGKCTSCNRLAGLNPLGYCPRETECTEER
jgi:hypothetical protein